MTADPVQMHQETGRVLTLRTLRLDAGGKTDLLQDAHEHCKLSLVRNFAERHPADSLARGPVYLTLGHLSLALLI